jgi:hypothetical protein
LNAIAWDEHTNREPILKIWREINAREQAEESHNPEEAKRMNDHLPEKSTN